MSVTEEGELTIVRCPIHGIAFDVEREECPECAKGKAATLDELDRARRQP
jgi:hypothetical protein